MVDISLRGRTIPYPVEGNYGSAHVILRSAYKGTGVIAGGAVRAVMDVVGIHDVLSKSLGSANQRNVAKATLNALAKLRRLSDIARLRGKTVEEIMKGTDVNAQ